MGAADAPPCGGTKQLSEMSRAELEGGALVFLAANAATLTNGLQIDLRQ